MTISELKRYIFEQEKIEYILEKLGCHNIRYNEKHEYYSASFPDGDNPQGINIRNNEYLNFRSFSRNVSYDDGKDIIDLIEYITNKNFIESVKCLYDLLGLEFKWERNAKKIKNKADPLEIFKKIRRAKKKINVEDIHVLNEEILNDYVPLLHIDWLKEGVMQWSAKKFGLAYSYRYKRVIIPHRHWLTGDLLGVNMRTTVKNYEELGIKKYYLTEGYNKSNNLYGLYENYKSIKQAGYVVVVESEKSVLKRDSLNDPTLVALAGKTLSDEQVRILIGLDVEIIIALDNDVAIEEIRHMCENFYRIRSVSYIKDLDCRLGEKDSIADARNDVYEDLINCRIKYDESEHKKYLKSLE